MVEGMRVSKVGNRASEVGVAIEKERGRLGRLNGASGEAE